MTGIKAIFRNGDIEEIYDLIEKNPEQEVKFCLIYEGRDIFFQLCRDRNVRLNTYMHYEGQMLSLVKTLYSANKEQEVFAILESDKDIRDNPYAKLTMSRDEREQLEVNKGKCIEVRHLTDILGFVRAACRCVGISYVYFSKLDLIIVVDELGGTMFGNRMMIETFLNELDVPYELNS